ncbi:hypothetical protein chiPu_0027642, partial [Chiloscyllium punctatum]|nr:hypothetical protein [Chiloscyllium punctatum]
MGRGGVGNRGNASPRHGASEGLHQVHRGDGLDDVDNLGGRKGLEGRQRRGGQSGLREGRALPADAGVGAQVAPQ